MGNKLTISRSGIDPSLREENLTETTFSIAMRMLDMGLVVAHKKFHINEYLFKQDLNDSLIVLAPYKLNALYTELTPYDVSTNYGPVMRNDLDWIVLKEDLEKYYEKVNDRIFHEITKNPQKTNIH